MLGSRPVLSPRKGLVLAVALAGCVRGVPPLGPQDAKERQRAEAAACWAGEWPPWLDDGALAEASRFDRWGTLGATPDESFIAGTRIFEPPPPPPRQGEGAGTRAQAIREARQDYHTRCSLLRSAGEGMVPSKRGAAAPGTQSDNFERK